MQQVRAELNTPLVVATTHTGPTRAAADPHRMARATVQEWTGQDWRIVEVLDGPGLVEPSPLEAASFPGQYLGQRVVTA